MQDIKILTNRKHYLSNIEGQIYCQQGFFWDIGDMLFPLPIKESSDKFPIGMICSLPKNQKRIDC